MMQDEDYELRPWSHRVCPSLFLQNLFVLESGEFPFLVDFPQCGGEGADFIIFATIFGDDGESGSEVDSSRIILNFNL